MHEAVWSQGGRTVKEEEENNRDEEEETEEGVGGGVQAITVRRSKKMP